jgi:hypothetical protein
MGTEWGLGPFTIEQTTEDVTAIHRLTASGLRGRTAISPAATGPATERRSAGRPALRPVTRAELAIGTAPNPGTSWGRRARSEREAGGALERRANETEAPAKAAVIREAMP